MNLRRPPDGVVFVARTHGLVGLTAAASLGVLHAITRDLPGVEFGVRTVAIAGSVAAFYLLTAIMVWLGAPLGSLFSRICSLLYLPRPSFGFRVWDAMGTEEFRAHFRGSVGRRDRER